MRRYFIGVILWEQYMKKAEGRHSNPKSNDTFDGIFSLHLPWMKEYAIPQNISKTTVPLSQGMTFSEHLNPERIYRILSNILRKGRRDWLRPFYCHFWTFTFIYGRDKSPLVQDPLYQPVGLRQIEYFTDWKSQSVGFFSAVWPFLFTHT